jgi:hypothetical protein
MKTYISNLLVRTAAILVISGICFFTYSALNLTEIFSVEINYLHWVGITVIITVLAPSSLKNIKNDVKGIKIP